MRICICPEVYVCTHMCRQQAKRKSMNEKWSELSSDVHIISWTWLTAGCFQCELDCTRHASISLPLLALSPAPRRKTHEWQSGAAVQGLLGGRLKKIAVQEKRQVTFHTLNLIALGSPADCGQCRSMQNQAMWLHLLILTRLAPAVATVGSDAQQKVSGNWSDGDHKTNKGNEEIIIQS